MNTLRIARSTQLPRFLALLLIGWVAASAPAGAMNYSTPYVRNGLPVTFGAMGFGAVIGELEVDHGGDNGINIYDNAPDWGLQTYRDVQNFSEGGLASSDDSAHGTLVAHIMDNMFSFDDTGSVPYASSQYFTTWSVGMAPRAEYHGALFGGSSDKSELISLNSSLASLTGASQVQAINNSWGGTVSRQAELDGNSVYSLLMDEYAGYKGKINGSATGYRDTLMVIAAGNEGTNGGLLTAPADSFNGLTVGALDVGSQSNYIDDPARVPLPKVASFSSWKPLANGRAGVDVVAPGSNLAVIEHFLVETDANSQLVVNDLAGVLGNGTSFAAPHVTGEAALLYGATKIPWDTSENIVSELTTTEKGQAFSTDHKLIKALIVNSADKIAGLDAEGVAQSNWQPGQVVLDPNGVPDAVVPLNYAVGAGKADALNAYLGYREIGNRFWYLNTATHTGEKDFFNFDSGDLVNETPGTSFLLSMTATLVWDRHVDFAVNTDLGDSTDFGTLTKNLLSNLDLILQREIAPDSWQDVYLSAGDLGSLEHIYIPSLSGNDHYRLEVVSTGLVDPSADGSYAENYALAVAFESVPEPGTWGMVLGGLLILGFCRRRV